MGSISTSNAIHFYFPMKPNMFRKLTLLMSLTLCGFVSSKYNTFLENDLNHRDIHSYINNIVTSDSSSNDSENTKEYWVTQAQDSLKEKLKRPLNIGVAKNVILFIGDGMSISTLTAARIHLGQKNYQTGEETRLSFEQFPYSGLSKTYCVNHQVADSACSATAYLCGIKANEATLGVTAAVKLGDCMGMQNTSNSVYSIAHWSQLNGKRTGLVTTATVTDASPAGLYAHTAHRDWENDADVTAAGFNPEDCPDIATQLIHGATGKNLNVILGGGRGQLLPKTHEDEEGETGQREDGRNLIDEWNYLKENSCHKYIYNRTQLVNLPNETEYVLGLFEKKDFKYNSDRDPIKKPSLAEMTEAAIKVLSNGEKGYFLFVEGGRIDHAHHASQPRRALDETIEFHKAVQMAVDSTNAEDTLIVVTSDHAHTMTISGYPRRGSDILGIGGRASDGLPYTTLSYANGLGYRKEEDGIRHDVSSDDFDDLDYKYPALVPLGSESHAGDDVGIFARGPWSHLLSGVLEQNFIPHVMAYASCVGEGVTVCDN